MEKKTGIVSCIMVAVAASAFFLGGCAGSGGEYAYVDMKTVFERNPKIVDAQNKMREEYDKVRAEVASEDGTIEPNKAREAQERLAKMENELFTPVNDDVFSKIDEVMKEKGYTAVYDKNAIIRGGTDITADVLVKEGIPLETAKKIVQDSNANVVNR